MPRVFPRRFPPADRPRSSSPRRREPRPNAAPLRGRQNQGQGRDTSRAHSSEARIEYKSQNIQERVSNTEDIRDRDFVITWSLAQKYQRVPLILQLISFLG